MNLRIYFLVLLISLQGCIPKDPVILKGINNPTMERAAGNQSVLKADALLYNPNKGRIRIREIQMTIFVNDKEAAVINQKLNTVIKPKSEFSVPLEVLISLKDIGIVDTLLGIIGGKSIDIRYSGFVRVRVNGIPVRVPVDHKSELRLRL